METKRLPKKANDLSTAVSVAGLIVGLCLAGSAFGAAPEQVDCDGFAKAAKRLESPLDALFIDPVDRSTDADSSAIAALDPAEFDHSSLAAPFLYLTPRVASVLREVFDTGRVAQISRDEKNTMLFSPLAEVDGKHDHGKFLQDSLPALAEKEIVLPSLQRQMFRTDI